jgi:hypothetical protein
MKHRILMAIVLFCAFCALILTAIYAPALTIASESRIFHSQLASETPLPPESWKYLQTQSRSARSQPDGPAVIIRVPEDYPTIAQALAVANSGDTVQVAPGVYCGNITVKAGVSLVGSGAFVTYVDGCAGGTVAYMQPDSAIAAMTIRNSGPEHWDAGIMAWQGTVTVERSVIRDNGMGIVLFCDNQTCSGRPRIINNLIFNNRNTGLRISSFHSADVINNTLVGNNDGITGESQSSLALNNIIAFHPFAGVWAIGGSAGSTHNNFWNNGTDFLNTPSWVGSYYLEPLFVNQGGSDFHLHGLSPLIDLGSHDLAPDHDIHLNIRPIDGNGDGVSVVDIGMDEYSSSPRPNTPTPTYTPTPTATPTASPTPGPAINTLSVFVISFPGYGGARGDPNDLTAEVIGLLKRSTMYHGYSDPSTPPYLDFQIYGGTVVEDPVLPPVLPSGMADYGAIYDRYNLCSLISQDIVDEVWIWTGNGDGITLPGFAEWLTSGPGWEGNFWPPAWMVNPPVCDRIVTTMAFNYTREVDVALESFSHRLEGFFMTYFPCDFYTETWPWNGAPQRCAGLVSDVYGLVARPFAGNANVAACGDAHHPPNILDDREYIYDDTTVVQTICTAWSQDGSAISTMVDCQAWGCTHWGYHVWWMQNLPGYHNTNRDRNGDLHPNWWSFILGPCYDYNQTGIVDALDIQKVANKWGLRHGDTGWIDHLDFDHDLDIDVVDVMRVASKWNTTCP